MRRRALLAAAAAPLFAAPVHAQFGRGWTRVPVVTAIAADAGDPRHALVDEAIAFWNATLQDLGSAFRLPTAERHVLPVPEDALRSLSLSLVGTGAAGIDMPASLRALPGDLRIVLAQSEFISFAGPFDADGRRVVGIKSARTWPLNQPNVALNVITHEIGHAIGLGHNADPTMLMCGRPATCRPDAFRSAQARIFPLAEGEKEELRRLYSGR